MPAPTWIERVRATARLDRDPVHRPPATAATAVATLAAVGGSVAVAASLVAVATRLFPSIEGYAHFRPSDYVTVTVVGVLAACLAWPVTARISSAPRWLFLRLAVLVTLVLWLPDIWLLVHGQPVRAVAVLMVMHLAIALVSYNLLVHLAPVRGAGPAAGPAPQAGPKAGPVVALSLGRARRAAVALGGLVVLECACGIGTLTAIPYDRPTGWLPARGHLLYVTHAALGAVLGVGAVALVLAARAAHRVARIATAMGLAGVLAAAGGGVASVAHPTRLLGIGLMLLGSVVAGLGYLLLVIDAPPADGEGAAGKR